MKISQILQQDGYRLSFEVFPPKKTTGLENVRRATEEIAKLSPSFMSVTYGAGGGTSDFTLDIAKNIIEKTGIPVLAHITCVSSDRETVARYIAALQENGIENVMALRGDLTPEMEGQDRSNWDYRHAYQLVEELKAAGDFCIGGACYPEVHPESSCRNEDILHLKEKVQAGCDFLTTQMFFDNEQYFQFVDHCRQAGITVPIIPGLKPMSSKRQIDLLPRSFHIDIPQELVGLMQQAKTAEAAYQTGIDWAIRQSRQLLEHGAPAIHYYTMAKTDNVCQIVKAVF